MDRYVLNQKPNKSRSAEKPISVNTISADLCESALTGFSY